MRNLRSNIVRQEPFGVLLANLNTALGQFCDFKIINAECKMNVD